MGQPIAVRTFRLDLGYDGSAFFGSQRQPGVRTVQGALESAAERLAGEPTRVALAGRTDRGVHAVGQVASLRIRWARSADELARALMALTPDDLVVYGAREVDERFHARFSARWREYRYFVWEGPVPTLMRGRVWVVRTPLNLAAMNAAADAFIGRRDFAAAAGAGVGVPWSGIDTTRTVSLARWRIVDQPFERHDRSGRLLEFRIRADGFLPHMVRNIVGSLVAVGRGDRPIGWTEELLAGRDRRRGEAPAPAQGLVLWRVAYDDDPDGAE